MFATFCMMDACDELTRGWLNLVEAVGSEDLLLNVRPAIILSNEFRLSFPEFF